MHIIWIVLTLSVTGCEMHPFDKEPMCTSRFDFEEKLLEKVLRMKITMGTVKDKVESELAQFGKDIAMFSLEFEKMQKEMSQTVTDFKDNFQELQGKADQKQKEMGYTVGTAVVEMKENIESTIKPGVVFHVQDVNGQPTSGSIIKFTTEVENTGDVYSLDTGCFTAPMNGTYWLSAQICTRTGAYMYLSLYIQDTLVYRKFIYDKDDGSCGAFTTVAVLLTDDVVCLKTDSSASNPVWISSSDNMNNFMGVLIY